MSRRRDPASAAHAAAGPLKVHCKTKDLRTRNSRIGRLQTGEAVGATVAEVIRGLQTALTAAVVVSATSACS